MHRFRLALFAAAAVLACGRAHAQPRRAEPARQCSLNSDCPPPMNCVSGACVPQCREDRDCTQAPRVRCHAFPDAPLYSYCVETVPPAPPPRAFTEVGTDARSVAVGRGASDVYGATRGGAGLRWTGAAFGPLAAANLAQVSAGTDGTVYGITTANEVFRLDQDHWVPIPGVALRRVHVGDATNVCGVTTAGGVVLRQGETWIAVPIASGTGGVRDVACAADGTLAIVRGDGTAYVRTQGTVWVPGRRGAQGQTWREAALPGRWDRIAVASYMAIVGIADGRAVLMLDGMRSTPIGPPPSATVAVTAIASPALRRLAGAPAGAPPPVQPASPSSSPALVDIDVGADRSVFAVDSTGRVLRLD